MHTSTIPDAALFRAQPKFLREVFKPLKTVSGFARLRQGRNDPAPWKSGPKEMSAGLEPPRTGRGLFRPNFPRKPGAARITARAARGYLERSGSCSWPGEEVSFSRRSKRCAGTTAAMGPACAAWEG